MRGAVRWSDSIAGAWKRDSSRRPWPSDVRIMATSTRWPCTPVTRPAQSPSMSMQPSSARPSSAKNATAASRSSTTMPALSIRSTVKTTPKLVLETSPLRDAQPRSGAHRYEKVTVFAPTPERCGGTTRACEAHVARTTMIGERWFPDAPAPAAAPSTLMGRRSAKALRPVSQPFRSSLEAPLLRCAPSTVHSRKESKMTVTNTNVCRCPNCHENCNCGCKNHAAAQPSRSKACKCEDACRCGSCRCGDGES